jgi:hypothetical protein
MELRRVHNGIASGSARLRLAVIFVTISFKRCDSPLMFEERGGIVEARAVDQPKRWVVATRMIRRKLVPRLSSGVTGHQLVLA